MNKEFKADHFENIEELLEHCNLWLKEEDSDAFHRYFDMGAMEELYNYIIKKQQRINKAIEYIEKERCGYELWDTIEDSWLYNLLYVLSILKGENNEIK